MQIVKDCVGSAGAGCKKKRPTGIYIIRVGRFGGFLGKGVIALLAIICGHADFCAHRVGACGCDVCGGRETHYLGFLD